jgi:DNA (cytosine-5)-methyltransferase 1
LLRKEQPPYIAARHPPSRIQPDEADPALRKGELDLTTKWVISLTPQGGPMRVGDLFSGCGGLSLGLENAGFQVQVAVEKWPSARKVHARNFDHPVLDLDVSDVNTVVEHLAPFQLEMIVGGPPCQDFSAAGTRSEGARAQLTVSFARVIADSRPTWFLLENVPQAQDSAAWAAARRMLKRSGYGISECVLNAAFFGVPQARKRFFAVGRLEEEDHFLETALTSRSSDLPLSVREHVGDSWGIDYYYRHPRNWGRKAIFSLDEPSATIRSTNRPVPPGYKAHPTDAGPYRNARPLTPLQRAQIQTFPSTFEFVGSLTDQDMMIANAVPVALAKHVGDVIMKYEAERGASTGDKVFRSWLQSSLGFTDRTAGNVASRLRRARKLLRDNQLASSPEELIERISRRAAFRDLSTSVRSQLRRAIHLYAEFKLGA